MLPGQLQVKGLAIEAGREIKVAFMDASENEIVTVVRSSSY